MRKPYRVSEDSVGPETLRKMIKTLESMGVTLESMGVTRTSEGYILYCDPALELDVTDEQLAELGVSRRPAGA